MSTNSLLTPCKQGAVLSRYSIGLGNVNELLTHTLQARCGTFTLLPFPYNENKLRTHTLQGAVHFFPAQFAIKNPPE